MLSEDYLAKKGAKNAQPEGPDPYIWMITFSDLLMLMLTMFVMRFSMLTLTPLKPAPRAVAGVATEQTPPPSSREAMKLAELSGSFSRIFGESTGNATSSPVKKFGSDIALRYENDILTASFFEGSFADGSELLTFKASEAVSTIVKTFDSPAFELNISAEAKIDTEYPGAFGSDGELSTARSLAVMRQMLDAGVDSKRLSASSYGSSRADAAVKTDNGSEFISRLDINIRTKKD